MADRNEKGQFYAGMKGAHTTHGLRKTRLYRIYINMKDRCTRDTNVSWSRYGAKGIKCEWKTFEEFRDDMGDSYEEHVLIHGERQTTIDRIDGTKNYLKENCRWATYKEQARNQSSNKIITFNDKKQNLSAWAEEYEMSQVVLGDRLRNRWSMEEAVSRKSHRLYEFRGEMKTLPQWVKEFGLSYGLVHGRMADGWTLERALTEKKHGNSNSR